MLRTFFFSLLLLTADIATAHAAATEELIERLDKTLARRDSYSGKKEMLLKRLREDISKTHDKRQRLLLYDRMYREYYTFRFDSAMQYTKREHALAVDLKDQRHVVLSLLHRSLLLATSGCYSEAEDIFQKVDTINFDRQLMMEYNWTGMWIYGYWSGYSNGNEFAREYGERRNHYLTQALKHSDHNSPTSYYLQAEKAYYIDRDREKAAKFYDLAVKKTPVNTRIYASASYGLARCYKEMGRMNLYEKWIILSAISDQVCPLKENLALQELAMYFFEKDRKNARKSSRYIYYSLADAEFYNNRLRILEISQKLPTIMSVYEGQLNQSRNQRTRQNYALGFLAAVLLAALYHILRQNNKLNKHRLEVTRQNVELSLLNERLRNTDATRGKYMRLFMDLCAIYISKLSDYQKLVVRKVKAHQEQELVSKAQSTKLTGQESAEFYTRFDKAFMELYPSFVDDFNSLLLPDRRLALSRDGGLTTEMRIYALVRLGVDESVEIATLLFYSPQTIYNYRTAMRKRALRPDTFETEVKQMA